MSYSTQVINAREQTNNQKDGVSSDGNQATIKTQPETYSSQKLYFIIS